MNYEVGDFINLPFSEKGEIKKIVTKTLDWFPYKVKIRKATFNVVNQILEFKESQLSK